MRIKGEQIKENEISFIGEGEVSGYNAHKELRELMESEIILSSGAEAIFKREEENKDLTQEQRQRLRLQLLLQDELGVLDETNTTPFLFLEEDDALNLTLLTVRNKLKEKRRETEEIQVIVKRAREAKSISKFKSPKGILDIAMEESPIFLNFCDCIAVMLEKQTKEFEEDSQDNKSTINRGIVPALKNTGLLQSWGYPPIVVEHLLGYPWIYFEKSAILKVRKKDSNYNGQTKEYEQIDRCIEILENKVKVLIPKGRDANGEMEYYRIPGAFPIVSQRGTIKGAIMILGEEFKTDKFNTQKVANLPNKRVTEIEKRLDIFFRKRSNKRRDKETLYIDDILHDIGIDKIKTYKSRSKSQIYSDFTDGVKSLKERGFPIKDYDIDGQNISVSY